MNNLTRARELRRDNTPMEVKLWSVLRARRFMGLKFRRQFPLEHYIVDFVCIEKMLIIEVDGSQHNESQQKNYDQNRTEFLKKLGYTVLRFWNNEIHSQFDSVLGRIHQHVLPVSYCLVSPHPPSAPSPAGEGLTPAICAE